MSPEATASLPFMGCAPPFLTHTKRSRCLWHWMRMSSTVATSICGSLGSRFDAFTLNAASIWICRQIYSGGANESEKKGIEIKRAHTLNPEQCTRRKPEIVRKSIRDTINSTQLFGLAFIDSSEETRFCNYGALRHRSIRHWMEDCLERNRAQCTLHI